MTPTYCGIQIVHDRDGYEFGRPASESALGWRSSASVRRADERQGMINHAADKDHFGTRLRFEKRDERTDGQ